MQKIYVTRKEERKVDYAPIVAKRPWPNNTSLVLNTCLIRIIIIAKHIYLTKGMPRFSQTYAGPILEIRKEVHGFADTADLDDDVM